ncbi:MAG: diacylglycerol/lipid kinase family protein [Beutenbergiaceae bacterium]
MWEQVVAVVALLLATAAMIIVVVLLRRYQPGSSSGQADREPGTREPARQVPAFVVNPGKVSRPQALHELADQLCAEMSLPEPLWFETTRSDPGAGQTREALAAGASVVIAAGGDGTVRAVAGALADSGVPMGLLPMGTANLLARNLDLPVDGIRSLMSTALTGTDHPIDLGWIRLTRPPHLDDRESAEQGSGHVPEPHEHPFLVMAGVGFDAAMVAGADDRLKARMGWMAYFIAGVQHLHGRKTRLTLSVGDTRAVPLRLRSLLFANCGRLPGGIVLLPDAELDDGWLDIAAIDTRGGLIGWASLLGKVVLQGIGYRRSFRGEPGSIEFWRARDVMVHLDHPEQIQIDGDLVGEAIGVAVRVDPGSLIVRTR